MPCRTAYLSPLLRTSPSYAWNVGENCCANTSLHTLNLHVYLRYSNVSQLDSGLYTTHVQEQEAQLELRITQKVFLLPTCLLKGVWWDFAGNKATAKTAINHFNITRTKLSNICKLKTDYPKNLHLKKVRHPTTGFSPQSISSRNEASYIISLSWFGYNFQILKPKM